MHNHAPPDYACPFCGRSADWFLVSALQTP
jgi:hypothetical protein